MPGELLLGAPGHAENQQGGSTFKAITFLSRLQESGEKEMLKVIPKCKSPCFAGSSLSSDTKPTYFHTFHHNNNDLGIQVPSCYLTCTSSIFFFFNYQIQKLTLPLNKGTAERNNAEL